MAGVKDTAKNNIGYVLELFIFFIFPPAALRLFY